MIISEEGPALIRWFRSRFKPYMTRPTVYQTFTRFIYALLLSLLWDRFVSDSLQSKAYAFLFFGAVFAILAWVSYLQLDGMRMPHLTDWMTSSLPQKKPERSYSDMSDYVDEDVVNYSELESDEKYMCRLIANAACAVLYILLSFIPW